MERSPTMVEAIRLAPTNAAAWSGRCWSRAVSGELAPALADCNEARALESSPGTLERRALVYLKSGQLDKAIADDDAALRRTRGLPARSTGAASRGVRSGQAAAGNADIAAAKRSTHASSTCSRPTTCSRSAPRRPRWKRRRQASRAPKSWGASGEPGEREAPRLRRRRPRTRSPPASARRRRPRRRRSRNGDVGLLACGAAIERASALDKQNGRDKPGHRPIGFARKDDQRRPPQRLSNDDRRNHRRCAARWHRTWPAAMSCRTASPSAAKRLPRCRHRRGHLGDRLFRLRGLGLRCVVSALPRRECVGAGFEVPASIMDAGFAFGGSGLADAMADVVSVSGTGACGGLT